MLNNNEMTLMTGNSSLNILAKANTTWILPWNHWKCQE